VSWWSYTDPMGLGFCVKCSLPRALHVWACLARCGRPLRMQGTSPVLHGYREHPYPIRHRNGVALLCPMETVRRMAEDAIRALQAKTQRPRVINIGEAQLVRVVRQGGEGK